MNEQLNLNINQQVGLSGAVSIRELMKRIQDLNNLRVLILGKISYLPLKKKLTMP